VQVLSHEPSEVDVWTKAFNSLFAVYGYDQTLSTSRLNEVRAQAGLPDIQPVLPETTLGGGAPSGTIGSDNVTIIFEPSPGNEDTECSLDGAPFTACTSPQEYTGLSEGSHTFQVRAVDPFGNVDPTPASTTWTVALSPPVDLAPFVISTIPTNGATGVSPNTTVTVQFSEAIKPATVTNSTIWLTKQGSRKAVPATVTLSSDSTIATLMPGRLLSKKTTYQLTVKPATAKDATNGVTDRAGNPLDCSNNNCSPSFTTLRR